MSSILQCFLMHTVLKFVCNFQEELKPTQKAGMGKPFELFFILIDTLKENGIHVTGAASQIGLNPVTVRSWRSRKSGPTQVHIENLIKAFPEQLKSKAEELGILTPALLSKEERLEQLLAVANQRIAQLEIELEEMEGQADQDREDLQTRINTLLRTLDKLSRQ